MLNKLIVLVTLATSFGIVPVSSSDCHSIRNADLRNYCLDRCSQVRDDDLRNYCHGRCDSIDNNDMKYLCRAEKRYPKGN